MYYSDREGRILDATNPAIKEAGKWSQLIEREGGARAYQQVKALYVNQEVGFAHNSMHLFAELLYKKEGDKSLEICDDAYEYACFHGLYRAAIGDQGSNAISRLEEYCISNTPESLDCPHGIGHGVIEYLTPNKIQEVLSLCNSLRTQPNKFGCMSGALMQYNFPEYDSEKEYRSLKTRAFTKENAYTPCDSASDEYVAVSCYFLSPQWWIRATDDYRMAGQLCENIGNEQYKKACFVGIGNQVNYRDARFNTDRIVKYCSEMPDRDSEDLCFYGALWGTSGSSDPDVYHKRLCDEIPSNKKEYCTYQLRDFINSGAL